MNQTVTNAIYHTLVHTCNYTYLVNVVWDNLNAIYTIILKRHKLFVNSMVFKTKVKIDFSEIYKM